jgi:HEAT repeat protein
MAPLGFKPSVPAIHAWLTQPFEDFRGVAAEALGRLGDKESINALEAALPPNRSPGSESR